MFTYKFEIFEIKLFPMLNAFSFSFDFTFFNESRTWTFNFSFGILFIYKIIWRLQKLKKSSLCFDKHIVQKKYTN